MNCKHLDLKNKYRTPNGFHCNLKNKCVITTKECQDCLLKVPYYPKVFEEIFKGVVK